MTFLDCETGKQLQEAFAGLLDEVKIIAIIYHYDHQQKHHYHDDHHQQNHHYHCHDDHEHKRYHEQYQHHLSHQYHAFLLFLNMISISISIASQS